MLQCPLHRRETVTLVCSAQSAERNKNENNKSRIIQQIGTSNKKSLQKKLVHHRKVTKLQQFRAFLQLVTLP